MATNGILFVSNAAKAYKLCSKVSKFVKDVLYINFNNGPDTAKSILNKQIVDIYTKVSQFKICWYILNTRIIELI